MTDDKEYGREDGKDIPPWLQPVPDEGNIDPTGNSNVVLYASIGVATVILGLFGWYIYSLYTDPPVVEPIFVAAPAGPTKERPEEVGGLNVPNRDLGIHENRDGKQATPGVKLGEYAETPITDIAADAPTEKSSDPIGDVIAAASGSADAQPETGPEKQPEAFDELKATVEKLRATVAAAPAAADAYRIQLGAYGSKKAAENAWRTVRAKFREQFTEKTADYEAVRSGDRTLYRLRVGPFKDRTAADQECLAMRASEQSCIVVNP